MSLMPFFDNDFHTVINVQIIFNLVIINEHSESYGFILIVHWFNIYVPFIDLKLEARNSSIMFSSTAVPHVLEELASSGLENTVYTLCRNSFGLQVESTLV